MADEQVPEPSKLDSMVEKLRAKAHDLPKGLEDVLLNYVIPILEEVREEYVGGFEALDDRVGAVEDAAGGPDAGFLKRVLQSLAAIGTLSDQALKRAGWADAEGAPVAECPDDIKIAFGSAQALAAAISGEIQEMLEGADDEEEEGEEEAKP